jgi:hypothetical protein
MVPLPPTLDADFVLFFGSHEGDTAAHAIALDATGQQLGSASAVEPVAVTSEGSYVLYRFEAFGARWELSTFRSGDGCALRQLPSGTGTGGSCELSTTSGRGHAFVYGSLPSKAASAEIVTQAGRTFPCLQVIKGPSGRRYFVIPLEGGGPGQLRYVDAEGNVLRHQRVTWRDPGRPI